MFPLSISYLPLSRLTPDRANARLHSTRQVEKIATSIDRFGFNNPILVDDGDNILAGHGRWRAAQRLGLDEVPIVRLEHISPAQKRAFMLADNRTAEEAEWDPELLASELQKLIQADEAFEITDTGFEMAEVDSFLLAPSDEDEEDPADLPIVTEKVPLLARPGDLWRVGADHLIFCGDALDQRSYQALLAGEQAKMVFSDPPYNRAASAISGSGKHKHGDFVQASGEMSSDEFRAFLETAFHCLAEASTSGSIHFICMDFRGLYELLTAGKGAYSELKNLAVWVKPNGGMGSFYRSQHELIAVFKSGAGKHINNMRLAATGRNRTNVWTYAGNSGFHRGRNEELALHPTIKPAALYSDAILDCSNRGSIILDPFGGSGTLIIAAERTGRRARLIERDPAYVDVALYRARKLLGLPVTNLWTGKMLEPLADQPRRTKHAGGCK